MSDKRQKEEEEDDAEEAEARVRKAMPANTEVDAFLPHGF